MGDGLQLPFVLLLCLNFCHGRNFLVQEALEQKETFLASVLISYDKKNILSTFEPRKFIPWDEKCRSEHLR